MEGDLVSVLKVHTVYDISIHSLRMEGDPLHNRILERLIYFNPLPPHGGRLKSVTALLSSIRFQSTPSAWRETSALYLS